MFNVSNKLQMPYSNLTCSFFSVDKSIWIFNSEIIRIIYVGKNALDTYNIRRLTCVKYVL
jgi:hypothetical protein